MTTSKKQTSSTEKSRKEVFFNKKQIEFLRARQKTLVFLGGRGSGKSTVIGAKNYIRMKAMPGAKVFLSSTTYNQLLTKTLGPMEAKWKEFGAIEGVHYVIGRKPPRWFKDPLVTPRKWEYFITWFNGYNIELLSMDRPDKARGGSYQAGDVDEAALIKQEHYTRVLRYSTRGFRHRFPTFQYGQIGLYTSMPWKPSGYWILDYEEKHEADPTSVLFLESTAYDNIDVLGEETLKLWEEETPYLEFQVEVMNRRVRAAQDAFYHKFDADAHCYQPHYLYTEGRRGLETKAVTDIDKNKIIEASFDFSGWFNCCLAFQQEGQVEKMVRSFFVKDKEKINALIDKFCDHFAEHKMKVVRVWGEPRGHDRNPLGPDIYSQMKARFESLGWKVIIAVPAKRTSNHKTRHTLINNCFAEIDKRHPKIRINQEHCKHVVIAIQITEIKPDYTKDKSKEKDRNFPQEHAPHFTDCLDYYITQKYGKKLQGGTPAGEVWT